MRTQGKWETRDSRIIVVSDFSGDFEQYIGTINGNSESKANAEFICKAVNNHTPMVELLTDILTWDGILPHSQARIKSVLDDIQQ